MYIPITAKSEEELNKRIADNEARGWSLVKKGTDTQHKRDWQYSESDRHYNFHGVNSYTKFTAVMRKEEAK